MTKYLRVIPLRPLCCVDSFFTLSVDKNRHFLTPFPPDLVHVVIECHLAEIVDNKLTGISITKTFDKYQGLMKKNEKKTYIPYIIYKVTFA